MSAKTWGRRVVWLSLIAGMGLGCLQCRADSPSSSTRSSETSRPSPKDGAPSLPSEERDASSRPDTTGRDLEARADADEPSSDATRTTPAIWRLPAGRDRWEIFDPADRSSRHAPDAEIVAAFDIEQSGFALVLTTDRLHVLHLRPPEWTRGRPLSQVSDVLEEARLRAAQSNPETSPNDTVSILGMRRGRPRRWSGQYDFESRELTGLQKGTSLEWPSPRAPDPSAIIAAWHDRDNSRNWLAGIPSCDRLPDSGFGPYVGYLTTQRMHLTDAVYCKDYFTSDPLARAPWPSRDRPPIDRVGATFWHRGDLYVIAAR